MILGACYIRVSTDEQTEFSPDAQLRVIKEYARKNDITLTKQHIYIDACDIIEPSQRNQQN